MFGEKDYETFATPYQNKAREFLEQDNPFRLGNEEQVAKEEQLLVSGEDEMDEENYQEHFRKTFITSQNLKKEDEDIWTLHDMQIPSG